MNLPHSQRITTCRLTGGPVIPVLHFGQHAYADTFVSESQLGISEPVFPLEVNLSVDSGLLQLGYMTRPEDRYNLYSYSYTSSNSATARRHWDSYAQSVLSRWPQARIVVEIGSNDGYLVQQFVSLDRRCIGIDPSPEMCQLAKQRGVEVMPALFNLPVAQDLQRRVGPADIVMANNVFNHADQPREFAQAVAELLSPQGVWIFEVPSWMAMIQSGRFTDMVYHEHPCYWTVRSVAHVLDQVGLTIVAFETVDYHGGSLRITAGHRDHHTQAPGIDQAMAQETAAGLFDPEFYTDLQQRFQRQRSQWLSDFYRLRQQDPHAVIIGVGAAAKANTWLTWHGLNATHLHCVTDASEFKQGKYTPLTRIPIRADAEFARHDSPYALILSWNISQGLKDAILNINPRTRFISQ